MASPLRPLEKVSGTVLIDTTALLKFSTWSILCETADIGRPKRTDAGGLCGEYEAWGESVARKFALESTMDPHGRPKRALKPQQRYRTPYPASTTVPDTLSSLQLWHRLKLVSACNSFCIFFRNHKSKDHFDQFARLDCEWPRPAQVQFQRNQLRLGPLVSLRAVRS